MNSINGKYLKKLREEHGYSIRTFAQMVYSSKSSVQRWEQSFAPENSEVLDAIANVYQISVEEMRKNSDKLFGETKTSAKEVMLNSDRNAFEGLTDTVKWMVIVSFISLIVVALLRITA